MRIAIHFCAVFLNCLLGFRPCVETVTQDWSMLASAAKVKGALHTTLNIL